MNETATVKISSFNELHNCLQECLLPSTWIFRGQSNYSWEIIPKSARASYRNRDDRQVFNLWKKSAFEYADWVPENDWQWLALAQHHGLATRLLDWSTNPLVAAFFACSSDLDLDGVIYAYLAKSAIHEQSFINSNPWDVEDIVKFDPIIKSRRRTNQGGIFTLSNQPEICVKQQLLEDEKLLEIIISKEYKHKLILELNRYGINWVNLFPDLDGLSKMSNWQVEYGQKYLTKQ